MRFGIDGPENAPWGDHGTRITTGGQGSKTKEGRGEITHDSMRVVKLMRVGSSKGGKKQNKINIKRGRRLGWMVERRRYGTIFCSF